MASHLASSGCWKARLGTKEQSIQHTWLFACGSWGLYKSGNFAENYCNILDDSIYIQLRNGRSWSLVIKEEWFQIGL